MRRSIKRRLSGLHSDKRRWHNNRTGKGSDKISRNHQIHKRERMQFKGNLTARKWKNGKAYFGNSGKSLKRKRYYINRK